MAAMRGPRLQVGSAAWVTEERASALQIADSEVEEFTYSAGNEFDWLNEHMASIFNENETNIAETFKTPGKLRGKTPRTVRKVQPGEPRVPLSNVFGATPTSTATRFTHQLGKSQTPRLEPGSPSPVKANSPRRNVFSPKPQSQPATQDSGYYGSQDVVSMDAHLAGVNDILHVDHATLHAPNPIPPKSPTRTIAFESPNKTFRTAEEDKTTRVLADDKGSVPASPFEAQKPTATDDAVTSPLASRHTPSSSVRAQLEPETIDEVKEIETQPDEPSPGNARSPSDGSSPIRPVVRKSSLNFASLPAREPLAAGKSAGARVSRTSHLDHNTTSYYNRHTGGKSLGNYAKQDETDDEDEDEDHDEMDVDDFPSIPTQESHETHDLAVHHNKTYTQRLQDQINMLGKSQPNGSRPSKSIHSLTSLQQPMSAASQSVQGSKSPSPKSPSPKKQEMTTTPGAFPEDDDDDWIDPPVVEAALPEPEASNTRPIFPKSNSTELMEGIHKDMVAVAEPVQVETNGSRSPLPSASPMPQRPSIFGHGKAASVSAVPTMSTYEHNDGSPLKKTVSVSNPALAMATVLENGHSQTPTKSPSRGFRDSPLKQVKNKLSSILKSSKGLLASSAAISAEGKSSILSPSTTRLGHYPAPSTESIVPKGSFDSQRMEVDSPSSRRAVSPTRPVPRRTRASVEREKEEKRREKEAMHMAEQMDKLEKAREQEREKVRVFSKEQEKIIAMEKQFASKKESEHPAPKETPKPTRTSPRKVKGQEQTVTKPTDQDVDMFDAPSTIPPPSASRSVGPGQSIRNKEIRRPGKPRKETQTKAKQAPTVIRVNTGSQHSQFQPSSSAMSASFQDTGSQSQQQLGSKASKATVQTKPSMPSLKSSTTSNGRPKALDTAARKKEQDDREAQRRREAKAEFERKRAVAQEESKKQELQRRQEAERQRKEREQAEAKKNTQRQAAIEKAKQTRAPPPAVRSQPNGPPDHSTAQDRFGSSQRDERQPARPPSRMNSGIYRQEDTGRPVSTVLSNASKAGPKRALGQDGNEAGQARHAPSYGGPQYQAKDAKRRRTSDDYTDELEMDNPPNIKGPPVRPSGAFKKDLQAKSVFQNGYSNVPQGATRDLFKATVTSQHTTQTKTAHPLDMAQISKGAIPFAPTSNSAGQPFKTPARPNGVKPPPKSALRSSPRFQNGESIELPEIMTDDEDEDDDDDAHGMTVAAWVDSPDLRRALMRQETMDPSQIFGPPAPLNMDEVFSKSKDKFHKFRARTSSANWSGADRLTEEDIRKDLAARDKMRREGGWSYELGREMM
ncbi:hypothetical protein AK830_g7810 [Neonectria ditissima]|uniref:Inner centromere protein ARK-binding domain-containing protein n=1 Tax=Neonectria ditissima TaxID=78410 RepID=A0A0P7BFG1_9HYPO|nr:hypothetical protein AK830_g7810 [Neonectria ditissima]